MSPFLAWGDFHARSQFARSTIPEEKWGTTRSLSVDLIRKLERAQRRATKYIIYHSFVSKHRDRLMKLNLLPVSYWHEFLDMIFFFKVVTGTVRVSPSVLPQVLVARTTGSNSNRNVTHFISRKCNMLFLCIVGISREVGEKKIMIYHCIFKSRYLYNYTVIAHTCLAFFVAESSIFFTQKRSPK